MMKNLPHPAVILDDSPQLRSVIAELEAGTYPQPDDAIWRDDLPPALAVRLAKATGATDAQIAAITCAPADVQYAVRAALAAKYGADMVTGEMVASVLASVAEVTRWPAPSTIKRPNG